MKTFFTEKPRAMGGANLHPKGLQTQSAPVGNDDYDDDFDYDDDDFYEDDDDYYPLNYSQRTPNRVVTRGS